MDETVSDFGKVLTLSVSLYFEPSLSCHNGNFCYC